MTDTIPSSIDFLDQGYVDEALSLCYSRAPSGEMQRPSSEEVGAMTEERVGNMILHSGAMVLHSAANGGCCVCGGLELSHRQRVLKFSCDSVCAECNEWRCNVFRGFQPGGAVRCQDALLGLASVAPSGIENTFARELANNQCSKVKSDAHKFAERLFCTALRSEVEYTPKSTRTNYLINYALHGSITGWPKVSAAWFVGCQIAHSPELGVRQCEMWLEDIARPVLIGHDTLLPKVWNIPKKEVTAIFHDNVKVSTREPPNTRTRRGGGKRKRSVMSGASHDESKDALSDSDGDGASATPLLLDTYHPARDMQALDVMTSHIGPFEAAPLASPLLEDVRAVFAKHQRVLTAKDESTIEDLAMRPFKRLEREAEVDEPGEETLQLQRRVDELEARESEMEAERLAWQWERSALLKEKETLSAELALSAAVPRLARSCAPPVMVTAHPTAVDLRPSPSLSTEA